MAFELYQPKQENIFDFVDMKQLSKFDLEQFVVKYSKRANERLRSLERHGFQSTSAYRTLEKYAFDNAEFMSQTRHGQIKFNTKIKGRTRNELLQELKKLDIFLNKAQTSTPTGVNKAYLKGFNEFRKHHTAYNYTYSQYLEMWTNDAYLNLINIFSSDEAVAIYEQGLDEGLTPEQINRAIDQLKARESAEEYARKFKEIALNENKSKKAKKLLALPEEQRDTAIRKEFSDRVYKRKWE